MSVVCGMPVAAPDVGPWPHSPNRGHDRAVSGFGDRRKETQWSAWARVGGRSPPDAEGFLPLGGRGAMRIPHQPRRPQPRPSRRFPHLVSLPPAHVLLPSCPSPWGGGAPTGCRISPAARAPPARRPHRDPWIAPGPAAAPRWYRTPPFPASHRSARAGRRLHPATVLGSQGPASTGRVPRSRDQVCRSPQLRRGPRTATAARAFQQDPPSRPALGCGEARSREGGELVPCRTGRVGRGGLQITDSPRRTEGPQLEAAPSAQGALSALMAPSALMETLRRRQRISPQAHAPGPSRSARAPLPHRSDWTPHQGVVRPTRSAARGHGIGRTPMLSRPP